MAALGRLAAIPVMEEQTSRMQEMLARIVKVQTEMKRPSAMDKVSAFRGQNGS